MTLPPQILSDILKRSTDAIVVADALGKIIFANKSAETLFGYTGSELLGSDIEILMPEPQRAVHNRHRQVYAEAPHTRPLFSGLELQGRRKNGEVFDAEIALTPLPTEDGFIVSSTIRDLSDDVRSERYFRNLLESAPDAMIIIDGRGRMTMVNHQAEQMFGYARREMWGQPIENLLPAVLRERHEKHREQYLRSPRVRPMGMNLELRGRRKDGTEFPVEISLSPVADGSQISVASVIRDVTERKLLEDELIEARNAAERANNANTAFLAAASHDLRQPVQALTLLNGALRRTVKEDLAREMVESQQLSLDAMTNLLNSLLDISRLDAGAVEPELEDFPIQRLIDRLSAECARQASSKHLRFHAANCTTVVRSDPNLLAEIIQNLVSNAIRYTDSGDVALECRTDGERLWVHVRDTGIGIEEDQQEAIFREFHQCKVPGAPSEGFGLGLAIVRRLADLLDIPIEVDSEPGRGSCFSIAVPIVTGRPEEAGTAAAARAPALAEQGMIVLIEDDVHVANAWALLLEAEGFSVATAASSKEAKALTRHLAARPDLVISDYHLADGPTGVQAVNAVRGAFAEDIPAFIVSGDTSKVVDEARSLPHSVLLSKPVQPDVLLDMARNAIRSGRIEPV